LCLTLVFCPLLQTDLEDPVGRVDLLEDGLVRLVVHKVRQELAAVFHLRKVKTAIQDEYTLLTREFSALVFLSSGIQPALDSSAKYVKYGVEFGEIFQIRE
jgi:hypothetical protein